MKDENNEKFKALLDHGIHIVAAHQDRRIGAIEDELGIMLKPDGGGKHLVQHYRKGNVPHYKKVIQMMEYCVEKGKLGVEWADQFLDYGRVPEREHYLYKLFPHLFPETKASSLNLNMRKGETGWFSPQMKKQSYPVSLLSSQSGLSWIRIPEGYFWMGSNREEDAEVRESETPKHSVYLPEYYIAQEPVTNGLYQSFVEDSGHPPPRYWENGVTPSYQEDHPVVGVSWFDAIAFCKWAKVRLLSEAEWEKAARGTDARRYPWGNHPPDRRLCNYDMNWGHTTPVHQFESRGASPYGVLEMAGNVWEWTSTLWGRDPSQTEFPYPYNPSDGRERINADESYYRIARGGAFDRYSQYIRSACRRCLSPNIKYKVVGFRVAK